jgi:flagellar hook protein FlgE
MSIVGNLYTGASGITSHSDAMNIISDNIANVNTVGFKGTRGNFEDVLGSMIAGRAAGAGSRLASTQSDFSQGSLVSTGKTTDLSVRGEGFFLAKGLVDGVDGTFFTRNGGFSLDKEGVLVNAAGLHIQGYSIDDNNNLSNTVGDLQLDLNSIPPRQTTTMALVANLDSTTVANSPPIFDVTNPGATSHFSTSITTYDSLGAPHQLEIFFEKVDIAGAEAQRWNYHILAKADEITPGTPGFVELTPTSDPLAAMEFDTVGALTAMTETSVTADWAQADSATVELDFGTLGGVDGITAYALDSTATYLSQDGYSSGDLAGLSINETGVLSGLFSNGQERVLGQVATAKFSSNDGLERRGGGLFAATRESGSPVIGQPSSGGRGSVVAGTLEASNIDLARQFVDMITIQRGFQSNSKTITTADEMLNTVLALKQ